MAVAAKKKKQAPKKQLKKKEKEIPAESNPDLVCA